MQPTPTNCQPKPAVKPSVNTTLRFFKKDIIISTTSIWAYCMYM